MTPSAAQRLKQTQGRVLAAIEQAAGPEPVAVIGLTATPYRNDERSMLSLLPVCAFAHSIPEMVQNGYLAPLTWKPVQVDLDLSQVATTLARKRLREDVTARLVEQTPRSSGSAPRWSSPPACSTPRT